VGLANASLVGVGHWQVKPVVVPALKIDGGLILFCSKAEMNKYSFVFAH
jgi:hypothetical protein